MKDVIYDEFQNKAEEVLIRHANILDLLSKFNEASAKSQRAVTKTITQCGCVKLHKNLDLTEKCCTDEDNTCSTPSKHQLDGEVCQICRDKIEEELGRLEFYVASICNIMDISMYDVMLKEYNKISTLGKFSLY